MRGLLLAPALLLLVAAADLPAEAPLPTDAARPADAPSAPDDAAAGREGEPPADTATDGAGAADTGEGRNDGGDAAQDPGAVDADEDEAAAGPPAPEPLGDAEIAACEAELRRLGAVFERREPISGDDGCGVPQPYNLREPAQGVILKPDTELTCPAALATVRWVQDVVQPAVRALGAGVRLAEVTHASTYVCRSRNNQPGAKISEHARGAAIDISGFDFDGRDPIPVVPRDGKGTIEEAFQRAVRAGACLHFTTVLGPGSDDYHDDHLHLDLAERRSGYRLCQ
jgi:hypothetical protein